MYVVQITSYFEFLMIKSISSFIVLTQFFHFNELNFFKLNQQYFFKVCAELTVMMLESCRWLLMCCYAFDTISCK